MVLGKIFRVFENEYVLADDLSVAAGGSEVTAAIDLPEQANVVGIGFHINTLLGSSNVEVEYLFGTDVSGSDHWITATEAEFSSTEADDGFMFDRPCKKVRLRITETGGTSGLEGITVWAESRSL